MHRWLLGYAALARADPTGFQTHSQPIRDAIDVVEVGHDLVEVEDRAVVPARRAERRQIVRPNGNGLERELRGVQEQGPIAGRHIGS